MQWNQTLIETASEDDLRDFYYSLIGTDTELHHICIWDMFNSEYGLTTHKDYTDENIELAFEHFFLDDPVNYLKKAGLLDKFADYMNGRDD